MSTTLPGAHNTMESWSAKSANAFSAWGALPLRLVVGYGFLIHGWAKLSRGPEGFAVVLHTLGVPAPLFLSWATTITELVGGVLVLAGAFIGIASIPMSIAVHGASALWLFLRETRRSYGEWNKVRTGRL
jgi:uncharacterized membrane protein YphA (DoxX/SURF4 family)